MIKCKHLTPKDSRIRLLDIAVCFLKISLSSFGGGLSAWVHQMVVDDRNWLTDEEFLSALAVCRILPGPNVANLAVFIGTRIRGLRGAAAALTGLIVIPFLIVLILGIIYFNLQHIPNVQSALRGAGAVAVGMTLGMGFKLLIRYSFDSWSIFIMVTAFIAIGVLRWPLIAVLVVLIPLSILLADGRSEGTPKEEGNGDK